MTFREPYGADHQRLRRLYQRPDYSWDRHDDRIRPGGHYGRLRRGRLRACRFARNDVVWRVRTLAGGAGVYGYDSQSGSGILGSSVSGYGVEGMASAANAWGGYFTNTGGGGALYAQATGGTVGTVIQAYSANGIGLSVQSTSNIPLYLTNAGDGVAASIGGNGISVGGDIEGTSIGVVGAGIDPFVVENTAGDDIFYVDDTGQVYAMGTYATFLATATRGRAPAFGETATTPTIEDTGSARLTDGSATVPLAAAFAQTIDSVTPYQVMITPAGETRGLYVANKTVSGFVVREVGDELMAPSPSITISTPPHWAAAANGWRSCRAAQRPARRDRDGPSAAKRGTFATAARGVRAICATREARLLR